MTLTYRLWGYRLNRLDEPVFMAVQKPMLTELGIHYRLESCVASKNLYYRSGTLMVAVNVVHLLTQPALPLRLGPAVEPPATSAMPAQTGVVNRTIVIRFQEGGAGGGLYGGIWH